MTCPRSLCQWKHDSGSGPSASEVPEIRSLLSLLLPFEEARCRGGLFWSAPAGHGHTGPWGGGGQSSRRPQSAPTREGQGERPATKRLRKSGCSGGVIQASARCQLGSDRLGGELAFLSFLSEIIPTPWASCETTGKSNFACAQWAAIPGTRCRSLTLRHTAAPEVVCAGSPLGGRARE